MTYVMSDLHGMYNSYIAMLELIFDNSRYSLNKILNLTIAAENLENVASFYESKKSTWQSYLDQYNDGYANYGTK